MIPEYKVNIISKEENLVWSKSFKALLQKFLPNENAKTNIFQEISFKQVTHHTDPNISSKIFIIIDNEQELKDNVGLISGLVNNKKVYIIFLSPTDFYKHLEGFFFHSNFFEYSSDGTSKRINPFTININSKLWVELVNIGSFIRSGELKNTSNTICIAWSSIELSSYRKLLASELQHNGYNVVLLNYNESKTSLLDKFKNCEYIIHPFGSHKSEKLAIDNTPSDRYQMDIASEYIQTEEDTVIKRFVWEMPIKSKVDDENLAYLNNLATDKYLLANADYLKIDFSKFKALIISEIRNRETEESFALQHSNTIVNILGIYQDAVNIEVELASKIKYNISPSIQLINLPDSFMTLRRFRAYLIDAEVVIIFYFEENTKWLKSKLIEIMKAPGYGRKKNWVAKYIITLDKSIIDDKLLTDDFEIIELNETNFLRKLQTDIENYKLIERNSI
ncbi:MAG: hypothetical protein KAI79_16245 [Bacteroidales bacterium]|nr:hypothetical protein [Bacteroidales bacterium]